MPLPERDAPILSVIVPIAGFPNGYEPFRSWFNNELNSQVEVILVVDSDDPFLISNLEHLSREIISANIILKSSSERNPGGTRNIGINIASGHWICFWDCDDYGVIKEMLRTIELSESCDCDLAVGNYEKVIESRLEQTEYKDNKSFWHERELYVNPGLWRTAIKRELVGDTRFPNIKMGEDQVFLFKLLQKNPRIHFSGKIVYRYVKYEKLQLTSDYHACKDLIFALKEIVHMYIANSSTNLLIGIYRQFLTTIKLGNWKVSNYGLKLLFYLWVKKPKALLYAPYCLIYIFGRRST